MQVSVDGRSLSLDALPATIGELIDDIKHNASCNKRVVLSVSVDGRDLDIDAQRAIAGVPVGEFSSLEIDTTDAKGLCLATLEESGRHIQPLAEESVRIAGLVDEGDHQEALTRLANCLEVCAAITTAIEQVAVLLELDATEVTDGDETLCEVVADFAAMLHGLHSAVDSGDVVAIRDTMKFEMPEIAARLSKQLTALCSAVAAS